MWHGVVNLQADLIGIFKERGLLSLPTFQTHQWETSLILSLRPHVWSASNHEELTWDIPARRRSKREVR